MASLSADRPSEVVLAARVARQFYLEGVSKVDIADRLGISRFRVARLLDFARESGPVRIEIGLSWSRTLSGLTAALTQLPPCPIVQLTGAVPPPDGRDLLDLVRSVARIGGGPAHVFYAPILLDDAQTAAAIRRQGDIAEAFALVPSVTIAVVAIGAWEPGLSTIYDAVTTAEREALTALGVHAELPGVLLGAEGRPLATPLDGRMIVAPVPLFTRIPFVLGVAYDAAKCPAVLAAIGGGLVHGLVTHTSLARGLLALAAGRDAHRGGA